MKIVSAGARLFLNRSAKNTEGGWTKGEMELSLEAALEPGDDEDEVLQHLSDTIRKQLYKNFKVDGNVNADRRKALKNWGRKHEL
jgi:hypothetical protein